MIYQITETEKAAPLFAGWEETLILSCLQKVMGQVYGNMAETPDSAAAVLGDFCFLAGTPCRELVLYQLRESNFKIMVPQNEQWGNLIEECFREKAKRTVRYAIKKEKDAFDTEKLNKIVEALPKEYTLQMIDETLFSYCKKMDWCRDFVSQYCDYAMYQKYGMGAVILKGGEVISGASSYSGYLGGIEIEVDTKEEYRRQGLAAVCSAKLILECLKRGWYPSWDAANKWSVALAEKLGYHFDHEYLAYEVKG